MKAILSLKSKGRRSSLTQYRAKQQPGLSIFSVNVALQGSIGLVLSMSTTGYPIVAADPDLSVHGGVCSAVQRGDIVHKINGEYTEGCSFGALVEKIRRTRPLKFEFVRPSTPELKSRFYGTPTPTEIVKTKGSIKDIQSEDEEDADWSSGSRSNGRRVVSRKKKEKLKKKIRR